jgi:hypothetical protein
VLGKFNMGKVVMTRAINDTVAESGLFSKEVLNALRRYFNCDWGDMCAADIKANDNAVRSNNDRIVAAYKTSEGKIYIITEYDHSYTTILFAGDY